MRLRECDVLDSRGIVVGQSWVEPNLDVLSSKPVPELVAGGWSREEIREIHKEADKLPYKKPINNIRS